MWSGKVSLEQLASFPNRSILIKNEPQGLPRRKENSPEGVGPVGGLHVVPIPTVALHQVAF